MAVKLNGDDTYEPILVTLTKDKFPIAFENKVQELLEEGCFETREEAEKVVSSYPIEIELYYEKGLGLFAVESGADPSSLPKVCNYQSRPALVA